jgi:subtilisin family serine protease
MVMRGVTGKTFLELSERDREFGENLYAEGIFYGASQDAASLLPYLDGAGPQPHSWATLPADFGPPGSLSFVSWSDAHLSVPLTETADHRLGAAVTAQAEVHEIIIQATPNDARYTDGSLWGMYGDASSLTNQFGSQAAEAWAQGHTGSMSNVIGVIDTGIDYTHPDLYLNIWLNQREIPISLRASLSDIDSDGLITFRDLNGSANATYVLDYNGNGRIEAGDLLNDARWENGTDEDGNGYRDDLIGWDFVNNDNDPYDDNNHGSHVAGTIGALGGNSIGVVGVNWQIQMVALKFLSSAGSGYTTGAIGAVNYFTNAAISARTAGSAENFVATSNSWGGGPYSQGLLDAITAAAKQDILFVAAAGNNNSDNDTAPRYPTGYSTAPDTGHEAVISVASITSSGSRSSFSNYGATSVDIAAPGSDVWSTISNGGYGSFNGTSMATPHVSGAVALYASLFPNATSAQIREVLLASVTYTSSVNDLVASDGRLNISTMLAVAPPFTEFADWLDGTLGGDSLNSRGGNDTVSAGTGNDTLDGGGGSDALSGADGNDWLFGGTSVVTRAFLPAQPSPLSFIDIGSGSAPTFADFDNDGDLDLLVGRSDGGLSSFRRNADGSFTPMDGVGGNPANPFGSIDIGSWSVPSFTDFDLNGTLDLVVGRNDGSLSAFRRNTDGSFTPMDGAGGNPANPFLGINVTAFSAPSFSDLDFDGDQDLVLGRTEGTISAFRRNDDGSYTSMDGLDGNPANPFSGIDVGFYSTPNFADLDFDGDADLVVGGNAGTLPAFRRNADGSYTPMNGLSGNPANPFAGINVGYDSAPVFADLSGDSIPDLVVGSGTGTLSLYVLTTNSSSSDSLTGGNGADTLNGADGADTLSGGSGNDLFIISDAFDRIIETAGGGEDTIITSVSITMPDQVEAMRIASDVTGITITGGAGNDMLIGNGLTNNFNGGSGDDVILAGNVTLAEIYALFAT